MGFPAYRTGMLQFGHGIPQKVQQIKLTSYLMTRIVKCNWQQLSNVFHVSVQFFLSCDAADYCVNGCAVPFVIQMALDHDKMPSRGS